MKLKLLLRYAILLLLSSAIKSTEINEVAMQQENRPKVGIGVVIVKDNQILLGRRKSKSTHGYGKWQPPGGHLEYFETFEECARREVLEETGLSIQNVRFGGVTNDFYQEEKKHYVTIIMLADYVDGMPQVLEPDKCEAWQWFSLNELPSPLFLSFENFVKQGTLHLALEKQQKSTILNREI